MVAQSIKFARPSPSSSIYCGSSRKALPLYHHRSSCVGSRTISTHQNRTPAASSNVLARLYLETKLHHTDLEATKATELRNWYTWSRRPNLRRKQINQHFDLGRVSRKFDKILFRGLLSKRVVLRWVEAPVKNVDWLSRTTSKSDAKRGPYTLIEVRKPVANGPWTLAIIQESLEAMLFEMTSVFFVMYIHNGIPFQRSHNRAKSRNQSVHGSSFRSLLRRVEKEAKGTIKGLSRQWQLNIPRR